MIIRKPKYPKYIC